MILEQIVDDLTTRLRDHALALFGHAVDRVVMQTPPRLSMGDLATPLALELAKPLKRKPREIAEELVRGLELPTFVKSVSVEGAGYLNFRLDRGQFVAAYLDLVMKPQRPSSRDRMIVEHTNINPNKAAHIGHLRNAVLGDTLVRCLEWLGHEVETQNYIDDTGVQVADVVVGFERILGENVEQVRARATSTNERFDFFCWDLYSRVGRYYEENPAAKEWQRETLHSIEKHEGDTAAIGAIVADSISRYHLRTALRLGIEYDLLVNESDIIRLRFWDRAFELLKESGAVVFEEEGRHKGCWVMKLSESPEFEGLEEPDKILVRSNGTVTYVGKDIAYQLWKMGKIDRTFGYREFERYSDGRVVWTTTTHDANPDAPHFGNAQRVFNVIDIRQSYLQKVVREGLRLLGYEKEAENSIHYSYEMVALTPATATTLGMKVSDADAGRAYLEMSGRKGLGVKADDLLDTLESKAAEAVRDGIAAGVRDAMSDDDIDKLSRQISVAALRYFMLKYGRNKVIAFDFKEALTFEGDSGPYLQYSTVRVENIFRKMKERGVDARLDADSINALTIGGEIADEMWDLVRSSAETPAVVRRAVDSLELSLLTRHAFDLAQKFNSFYHKYPILNEPDAAERQRRAVCAEVFRRTMRGMFDLIGIALPERM